RDLAQKAKQPQLHPMKNVWLEEITQHAAPKVAAWKAEHGKDVERAQKPPLSADEIAALQSAGQRVLARLDEWEKRLPPDDPHHAEVAVYRQHVHQAMAKGAGLAGQSGKTAIELLWKSGDEVVRIDGKIPNA